MKYTLSILFLPNTITELLKHTTISVVQFRFFVREFRIIVFSCLRVHYSEDGAYPPFSPRFRQTPRVLLMTSF